MKYFIFHIIILSVVLTGITTNFNNILYAQDSSSNNNTINKNNQEQNAPSHYINISYTYEPFLILNGTDFIDISHNKTFSLNNFTIAAWIKTNQSELLDPAHIVNKGGFNTDKRGENMNYGIWLSKNGTIQGGFETESGENYEVNSTIKYNDGKWHFVLLSYDGTLLRLYIDELSFVPHKVTLPPPLDMAYNVTIYNEKMDNTIYNRQFGDIDGILDLEIIPVKGIKGVPEQIKEVSSNDNITTFEKQQLNNSAAVVRERPTTNNNNNTTNTNREDLGNEKDSPTMLSNTSSIPLSKSTIKTTTYGPDLSGPITGTYHIEGPILVEPNDYIIKVELISIDGKSLSEPIEDVFLLPAKL